MSPQRISPGILWAAILFLALALLVGIFWYTVYVQPGRFPEGHRRVPGLQHTVTAGIDREQAFILLRADAWSPDIWTGLGYAHGLLQPAEVLLLRQMARGRLHRWFDTLAVPIDRMVLETGIPARADQAFAALAPEQQEALRAYARGIRLALQETYAQQHPQMLALPARPDTAWHAEDAVAVELLLRLTTLDVPADTDTAFVQRLQQLKEALGFDGWAFGLSGYRSSTEEAFGRWVYGTRIPPPMVGTLLQVADTSVFLLSMPGTLLFPAGATSSHTWLLSLYTPTSVEPVDSLPPPVWHRLPAGAREVRFPTRWTSGTLILPSHPFLRLHSDALEAASLAPVMLDLLRVPRTSPLPDRLLLASRGSPSAFLYHRPWSASARQAIETTPRWWTDAHSLWAEEQFRLLRPALRVARKAPHLEEAVSFLENWDFRYTKNSIGAAIFEAWVHRMGIEPLRSLEEALQYLRSRYGPDPAYWQWQSVQETCYRFGLFSDVRFTGKRALHTYTPICEGHDGHPTAPRWARSLRLPPSVSAAVELRITADSLFIRHPRFSVTRLLPRLRTEPLLQELRLSRLHPETALSLSTITLEPR